MRYKLLNRELSWLSFNQRVLQEASDPTVPLYERIKFLAIFSSNLDEFFRVRVAALRSLLNLKQKTQQQLDFDPVKLLKKIHEKVLQLQEEYGKIYHDKIIPELNKNNIFLADVKDLNPIQAEFVKEFFNNQVLPHITPMIIFKKKMTTFLRNNRLYLAVKLSSKQKGKLSSLNLKSFKHALVEIPSNHIQRFITLPKIENKNYIIFLDDIIRFCLPKIFYGYKVIESYSIKLTRDAELYIDDEFSGNLLEKIKKGLSKRGTGIPCRFLYDKEMPSSFIKFLRQALQLDKEDLYHGGRYHSFSDFSNFPNPGLKELEYKPFSPLKRKEYDSYSNKFETWSQKDFLFYFPYHSYDYVVQALNTAARDANVTSIKITVYRMAKDSSILRALIKAVKRGKSVTAFIEIKARFDEESNIKNAEEMQKAGIKVIYSLPGLKVHAKMALISRTENERIKNYAYLSTGNFNEKTARIYTDFGFFTSDDRITDEVSQVFDFLENNTKNTKFNHLLVAKFNMSRVLINMIDNEINNAKSRENASIIIKVNSLEDDKIIRKLYEASKSGVKISIIARCICCLMPGVEKQSENINTISIVDRFLEHTRVFIFHNKGNEKVYISSADLMKRNLSRRIEVAFPIYDEDIKKEIKDIIGLQLKDNTKTRIIDAKQKNEYRKPQFDKLIRSQYDIYNYLKSKS